MSQSKKKSVFPSFFLSAALLGACGGPAEPSGQPVAGAAPTADRVEVITMALTNEAVIAGLALPIDTNQGEGVCSPFYPATESRDYGDYQWPNRCSIMEALPLPEEQRPLGRFRCLKVEDGKISVHEGRIHVYHDYTRTVYEGQTPGVRSRQEHRYAVLTSSTGVSLCRIPRFGVK